MHSSEVTECAWALRCTFAPVDLAVDLAWRRTLLVQQHATRRVRTVVGLGVTWAMGLRKFRIPYGFCSLDSGCDQGDPSINGPTQKDGVSIRFSSALDQGLPQSPGRIGIEMRAAKFCCGESLSFEA